MATPQYGDRVMARMNKEKHGHQGWVRGVVIGAISPKKGARTLYYAVRGTWGIAQFWRDDVKKIKGSKRVYGKRYWTYNEAGKPVQKVERL